MAFQQALNTILSVLLAAYLAEWADAKLGEGEQIAQIQLALTVVLGGLFSFVLEFARALILDLVPAGRFPRIYKLLGGTLLALALVACGTTPTDRYYSALSGLAGVRASAIAACRTDAVPVAICASIREGFFVPGDAAIEALENARQAVLTACPSDSTSPACIGAGRQLSAAAAGVAAITTDLTRALAAHGVRP